ncbi:MAG: putative CRISPR-associated protein [Syntrophomonadaceae bacterium]|nr:putative CRISPR-associated protein [Syntrophomonadaceae bacterium]
MRKVLCTVGTSLAGNAFRQEGRKLNAAELTQFITKTRVVQACAETNSLSRILQDGDRILFMHSETDDGRLCAEALVEYYRKQGRIAELKPIAGLTYSHQVFSFHGLRRLVDSLIEAIRLARRLNLEPVINATGGFKAEIAYATLVGLLFKVPVYYIYEAFQEIIEMPAVPVDWDYTLMAEYEDFFEWLQTELRRTQKTENRLRGMPPELRQFLVNTEDGYTLLSPAGEVYFRAYQELKETAGTVVLSQQAKRYYHKLDDNQKAVFDSILKKLCLERLRAGGSGRVHTSECVVFPRGGSKERVFYFEDNNTVYVCELARHEDNYEDLLRKGVKKSDYGPFEPHFS